MLTECANCREPLYENIKLCPQCGTANPAYEAPRWRRIALIVGVCIAVFILNEILSDVVPGSVLLLATLGLVVFSLVMGVYVLRDRGPKVILLWVAGNVGAFAVAIVAAGIATVIFHMRIPFVYLYGAGVVALLKWLKDRPKPA
jgi:hypothetical protein